MLICLLQVQAVVVVVDYSYKYWNVNQFQELMEELKIVHDLAYKLLLKCPAFLQCQLPVSVSLKMIRKKIKKLLFNVLKYNRYAP